MSDFDVADLEKLHLPHAKLLYIVAHLFDIQRLNNDQKLKMKRK